MLEIFRSQIVEISHEFQHNIPWVYRMDGDGDDMPCMMTHVGLIRCNCCDYFFSCNGEIVLIEVTALFLWKDSRNMDFINMGMDENSASDFAWKMARQENRLKVFGSMLTLCRYAKKCTEVAEMTRKDKYRFWLIVSDVADHRNAKVLRNFKANLRDGLAGSFSLEMLTEVNVFGPRDFQSKMHEIAT